MTGCSNFAVILLNYRRPQNMKPIISACRAALPEAELFLIDHSEQEQYQAPVDLSWSDIWFRAQPNQGCVVRLELAARLPFENYFCVDDDILIEPEQISALVRAYLQEPDRVHSAAGQIFFARDGQVVAKRGIRTSSRPVSVANQLYLFRRRQAQDALALRERLDQEIADRVPRRHCDDMFLSCAGDKPPLCHDVGELNACPSGLDPSIAVWARPGQMDARLFLANVLASRGLLHVADAADELETLRSSALTS